MSPSPQPETLQIKFELIILGLPAQAPLCPQPVSSLVQPQILSWLDPEPSPVASWNWWSVLLSHTQAAIPTVLPPTTEPSRRDHSHV